MAWNEIIHARMVFLLEGGYSATLTAKALNEEYCQSFTRNAIIGRAHRNGIRFRRRPTNAMSAVPRGPRPQPGSRRSLKRHFPPPKRIPVVHPARVQALALLATEPVDLPADFLAFACTLQELQDTSCRYPLGDPQTADFRFCGARKLEDAPYCARHFMRTHRPPDQRNKSVPAASVETFSMM